MERMCFSRSAAVDLPYLAVAMLSEQTAYEPSKYRSYTSRQSIHDFRPRCPSRVQLTVCERLATRDSMQPANTCRLYTRTFAKLLMLGLQNTLVCTKVFRPTGCLDLTPAYLSCYCYFNRERCFLP